MLAWNSSAVRESRKALQVVTTDFIVVAETDPEHSFPTIPNLGLLERGKNKGLTPKTMALC